ncbi:MAG: hypothetical protein IPL53_02015 [Ignavibacteria bacterium]|nr:hypothetical protein [Ignavibacteria bacterium]
MLKSLLFVLLSAFALMTGCSNDDDPVTPNNPTTGEVLLAEVSSDSVGSVGASFRTSTITSSTLNFTDRDSARISFFYTGENNSIASPLLIYYKINDSTNVDIFNSTALSPTVSEKFVNVTIPSPKVNSTFYYRISTVAGSPGFSYFKFRELKIYKK